MAKELPVYDIKDFGHHEPDFYINRLKPHIQNHHFTRLPHKHDFYLTILITRGSGWHEIDFTRYHAKQGDVFLMQPGQMHYWKFSKETDGYVLFHSKNFYNEAYTSKGIQNFPFFRSVQGHPVIKTAGSTSLALQKIFRQLLNENGEKKMMQAEKMHALLTLLYVELARRYKGSGKEEKNVYLEKLQEFESLIEKHYKQIKSAGKYARLLNISEKHLNRIARSTINKTSTQIIAERVILEAKRMLIHGKLTVSQIADELGFSDISYFVRMFKKNTGLTPREFLRSYK